MCCPLDLVCLVLIMLPLMAKYKSAMVYQYQLDQFQQNEDGQTSSLRTASAKKMLYISVGPIQSQWHSGMLM